MSLSSTLVMYDSVIEGNVASQGGGIRCGISTITMYSSRIDRNEANSAGISGVEEGGDVYILLAGNLGV